MFFFFSKTINFITMPLVIISLLFLGAVFLRPKKWKRRLFTAGLIALLFWSNDFITNEFIIAWEVPATPIASIRKHYEWGIILSGVVKSEMIPNDRIYISHGADRVIHAFQLYKLGIIKKILVSGGSGRLIDIGQREADDIKTLLVLWGTNPEDIVTENKSRNTHESAVEVKNMLQAISRPEDCLLITSAFHMRRSAACFKKAGWKTDIYSTDFLSHQRRFSADVLFVPQVEALYNWNVLIKEWVGYVAYSLAGYI